MTISAILTMIFASAGLIVMVISLIGIIRLPDFYARLHAQGVGDTLGALLLLIAMMIASGAGLLSVKIFLLFAVLALTNPLGTNLMMIAGMNNKDYREYKKDRKVKTETDGGGNDTDS